MAVRHSATRRSGVRGPVDSGRLRVGEKSLKVDELAKAESGVDAERSVVRNCGYWTKSVFRGPTGNEADARPVGEIAFSPEAREIVCGRNQIHFPRLHVQKAEFHGPALPDTRNTGVDRHLGLRRIDADPAPKEDLRFLVRSEVEDARVFQEKRGASPGRTD